MYYVNEMLILYQKNKKLCLLATDRISCAFEFKSYDTWRIINNIISLLYIYIVHIVKFILKIIDT